MPYSSELGMRVYDPQEGERYGLQVGQMAARAFEEAKNRQLDQRKLQMLEQANRAKASQLMMETAGFAELQDMVNGGTPFEEAFFKAAPKLFAGNPQGLGRVMQGMARDKATETYRNIMVQKAREAAEANQEIRRLAAERSLAASLKPPAKAASLQEAEQIRDLNSKLRESQKRLSGWRPPMEITPEVIKERELQQQYQDEIQALKARREPREPTQLARDRFALDREKFAETQKQHAIMREFKIDQNKQLAEWRTQLADAKNALAKIKATSPSHMPWGDHADDLKKKQEATEKEISDLQKQISDRIKELRSTGGETSDTTTAEPPQPGDESGDFSERQQPTASNQAAQVKLGALVEQDGKRYRYQGGDVNDPASWVEVK